MAGEAFSDFEHMRKGLQYIIIMALAVVFASAVHAQEGAAEIDPFYPSADRPSVTAPVPGGADNSWGRDPFANPLAGRAPVQKGPPPPGQGRALTGIIFSKDVRVAIIGGETFRENDKVGDRKLVKISSRSVVLVNATGEREEMFLEDFSMSK
jgi:hypothetical protein